MQICYVYIYIHTYKYIRRNDTNLPPFVIEKEVRECEFLSPGMTQGYNWTHLSFIDKS